MSNLQPRSSIPAIRSKQYRLVKGLPLTMKHAKHQSKLIFQEPEKHFDKSQIHGRSKKLRKSERKIPQIEETPDCRTKKAKIRIKALGQKVTIYEYMTISEYDLLVKEALEMIPRSSAKPMMNEPNPNSLRFPAEFKRRRKKKTKKIPVNDAEKLTIDPTSNVEDNLKQESSIDNDQKVSF